MEVTQSERSLIDSGVVADVEEYATLRKEFKVLSFTATITVTVYGDSIGRIKKEHGVLYYPAIRRTSYFKFESCITTDYMRAQYADLHEYFQHSVANGADAEPVFVDVAMTKAMLRREAMWDLRLCRCK